MHRRTCLKSLAACAAAGALPASAAGNPIQLHVDLDVDPSKEKELVTNYRRVFRPAIGKQPGFVSVRLLKLRGAVAGPAPPKAACRLVISFRTEEQRQAWVKSDDHQRAWPAIEKTINTANLKAILYDEL